ncbi:MAG: HDOD domain-containing protein [Phycisphaerales bacterium]|nr:HDOD domain-containing protein [Phycisphaerales bacterium]
MDTDLLTDILNCPSLPSLPAVAAKVLELTSDPDVKMTELASQITMDQALSAKVLRTVNSSFYGLRKRCSSIEKALIMLGLGPVKSLVLGFSLVSAFEGQDGDTFDYSSYWDRGLNTAIAGKIVADMKGYVDVTDECFLAGLLQDIGMIAMYRAMGEQYNLIVAGAGNDHFKLARAELIEFELQHAGVGASIAERWNLPAEIAVPINYHERPTACPSEYSKVARCIAFGNLVHAVLSSDSPTDDLRTAYSRGQTWLDLNETEIDEIIIETGNAAKEMAKVLEVDVGKNESPEDILIRADRKLIAMARDGEVQGFAANEVGSLAEGIEAIDPMTGVLNREGFKHAIRQVYSVVKPGEVDITVIQLSLAGLGEVNKTIGQESHDDIIIGTSMILIKYFEPMGGAICRLGDHSFGVVLPDVDRVTASRSAAAFAKQFAEALGRWIPDVPEVEKMVKVYIGLATLDEGTAILFVSPEKLVMASTKAVQAAQVCSTSAIRTFVPKAA